MNKRTLGERVYRFIHAYLDAKGYPPDLEETAVGCAMTPAAVARQLYKLETQGRITRTPGKARGIWLTERRRTPMGALAQ